MPIACSLDVFVKAATNSTPRGCARLGSLHDMSGVPFSTSPRLPPPLPPVPPPLPLLPPLMLLL